MVGDGSQDELGGRLLGEAVPVGAEDNASTQSVKLVPGGFCVCFKDYEVH